MCNNNLVKVNGNYIKPSKKIRQDDVIDIETAKGIRHIKVLRIPTGNIGKDEITTYYEEL